MNYCYLQNDIYYEDYFQQNTIISNQVTLLLGKLNTLTIRFRIQFSNDTVIC